ncbi:MAG: PrsW family intramembrane metalloprotease [Thermoplasmata archaeon]|nr:PrsW family intramembrane metalloprotease [Thermoplasmata archaeon]
MSDLGALQDLAILILAALFPALIWLAWVRSSERTDAPGWGPLLGAFAYGALFATFIAAIAEGLILAGGAAVSQSYPAPEFTFLNPTSPWSLFFVVLVVAPVTEEALKASGVVRYSDTFRHVADGPVFGASVGLGFGFFETFLYGLGAFLAGGLIAGIALIAIRSVSSVLLHGSTTSMFGYGYAEGKIGRGGWTGASYYLLAVGMHASFNLLASLGTVVALLGLGTNDQNLASLVGLGLAVLYAFAAIGHARSVIQRAEFPGAQAVHPRFRPPPVRRAGVPPPRR